MSQNLVKDTAKDLLYSALLKCGYKKYADSKSPSIKPQGLRIDRFNSMLAEWKQKRADEAAKAEQAALEEQKAKMENSAPPPQDQTPQTPVDQWKQNVSNFANTSQNIGTNTNPAPANSPQDAGLPTPPSTQLPPKTSPNMKVASQNVTFKWKVNFNE